ncbi:hypothetical protein [Streptomyces sp. NRRL S-1022]|uniref:hypothetical protein n=1 Tax=Streptomyces sp. NRRL S-1022 TaxID=1463880 RepID=UPI001F2EFC3D|nr:hypothetical protein [Streptomyces sp. NRRL S-1022]
MRMTSSGMVPVLCSPPMARTGTLSGPSSRQRDVDVDGVLRDRSRRGGLGREGVSEVDLLAAGDHAFVDVRQPVEGEVPQHLVGGRVRHQRRGRGQAGDDGLADGEAGTVGGGVTWDDLLPLMCGIAFAANVHADDQQTRLESGRRYLGVMLQGMHS